jgi:hypothetical protein
VIWNIQTFALGLLAAAVITGGAYIKGRGDGRAVEIAQRATLDDVARVSREGAISAAAAAIAKISVTHTTIRQRAEVTVREKPVYRDCVNDPAVERLLDSARANAPAPEPAGDSGVSGAGEGQP